MSEQQTSPIAPRDILDIHIPPFRYAPRSIGILLFPGVEELDATGPWEVLAVWTKWFPGDGFEVFCMSRDGDPVTCARGLVVGAHHSYDTMPPLDVLLHPGGNITSLMNDQKHLAWLKQQRQVVPLLVSVCNGSVVYAAAGLLAGRPATSWSLDQLTQVDPTIKPQPNVRFVDDGDIITSAGVSAGIDMAFHLIARLTCVQRAQWVRKFIQYDPAPPV